MGSFGIGGLAQQRVGEREEGEEVMRGRKEGGREEERKRGKRRTITPESVLVSTGNRGVTPASTGEFR